MQKPPRFKCGGSKTETLIRSVGALQFFTGRDDRATTLHALVARKKATQRPAIMLCVIAGPPPRGGLTANTHRIPSQARVFVSGHATATVARQGLVPYRFGRRGTVSKRVKLPRLAWVEGPLWIGHAWWCECRNVLPGQDASLRGKGLQSRAQYGRGVSENALQVYPVLEPGGSRGARTRHRR